MTMISDILIEVWLVEFCQATSMEGVQSGLQTDYTLRVYLPPNTLMKKCRLKILE